MSEEFEPCRRFAIDFPRKKRPVVKCMIRSTLKEILQMAGTDSPPRVDTANVNVERVKNFIHPSILATISERKPLVIFTENQDTNQHPT